MSAARRHLQHRVPRRPRARRNRHRRPADPAGLQSCLQRAAATTGGDRHQGTPQTVPRPVLPGRESGPKRDGAAQRRCSKRLGLETSETLLFCQHCPARCPVDRRDDSLPWTEALLFCGQKRRFSSVDSRDAPLLLVLRDVAAKRCFSKWQGRKVA